LCYRLRQEFGIIKKLEKKFMLKDILSNDQNKYKSEKSDSLNNNDEKLFITKAENKQKEIDCSYTSCECRRCINMNGN